MDEYTEAHVNRCYACDDRAYKLYHIKGARRWVCRECYRELHYGEIPKNTWRR